MTKIYKYIILHTERLNDPNTMLWLNALNAARVSMSDSSRTFGSDIFYIESCVYLMTLYDLLTSGHMVWLVYDAFYSNGEEDQETFTEMVKNSVRLNFGYFMERSDFRQFAKAEAIADEICNKNINIKDILNKYNIDKVVYDLNDIVHLGRFE